MDCNNMEDVNEEFKETEDRQYTTFRGTYKLITFAMGIGLVYPNKKLERRRFICILLLLLSIAPVTFIIFVDGYNSWMRRDIMNVIRHGTVAGPFLAGFLKMFIMFYKRVPSEQLLDAIDRDLASYNRLPATYKRIVNASIRNNVVYSEKAWAVTVAVCVMTFPVMAVVQTAYSFAFQSEPVKYMIHDVNIPFTEPEARFEWPFFEIMFVYMFYCSIFYTIYFTGYDGYFGLCINHACLRMELYCKAFEDALKAGSNEAMRQKLIAVIKDQISTFEFIDLIQETFNIWFGLILIATMIQICNCMYHITEGYGLDVRYIIFMCGTVAHIYLPCRYCSKLKHMSSETATRFYCSGWECVTDLSTRKTICFMIARAQRPSELTAFNMLLIDMELFVTILQTSYSMYTLLRS